MVNQVFRNERDSFFRADHRFKSSPLGAQLLLVGLFLPLGDLFKLRVDCRLFLFPQIDLCQSSFVKDGNSSAVLECPQDVVFIDVVAEDRRRAAVVTFDGRTRKPNEGRIRQSVVHVARESVDEVILTAVRFIGNDHDIPTSG